MDFAGSAGAGSPTGGSFSGVVVAGALVSFVAPGVLPVSAPAAGTARAQALAKSFHNGLCLVASALAGAAIALIALVISCWLTSPLNPNPAKS